MPINLNGYNLSNDSSSLKLGNSNSRITPGSYGVKNPFLPGMNGCCWTGSATYKAYPFQVNSLDLITNGVWSTTTYMFTAPQAGVYYTSFGGIVGDGAGAAGYNSIIVNGGLKYFSYRDTSGSWILHHVEMIIKLAQGDTLAWAMNKAPGPEAANAAGAYTSNHNTCAIWLVG